MQSSLALSAGTGYFLALTCANGMKSFTHTISNESPTNSVELAGRRSDAGSGTPDLPANLNGFSRNPSESIWLAVL